MRRHVPKLLAAVAVVCLWRAWASSGVIQGATFMRDEPSDIPAGSETSEGWYVALSAEPVLWLAAAVVLLAAAFVVHRRRSTC